VVVAFSRGGETDELNSMLRIARQRDPKVVSVLEDSGPLTAGLSDLVLQVQVAPHSDALGPLPLTSRLVHAALADVLCAAVLTVRGFDPGDFARVHPGGAVGKRLRAAGD
jgi:arabinose-5-phosphate isomerase